MAQHSIEIKQVIFLTELLKRHSLFLLNSLRKLFNTALISSVKDDQYIQHVVIQIRKKTETLKQWEVIIKTRVAWLQILCNRIVSTTCRVVLDKNLDGVSICDFSARLLDNCLMWVYIHPSIIRSHNDTTNAVLLIRDCWDEFISESITLYSSWCDNSPPEIQPAKPVCIQVEIPEQNFQYEE